MSHQLIEEKRIKLLKEIEIAKFHLESNIEQIQPADYLPSSKDLIPNLATSLIPGFTSLLPQLDTISKKFLPNNNILKSILTILNILK